MSTHFTLANTLEKLTNKDKDHRYMAASDLQAALVAETYRADPVGEAKLVAAMAAALEDASPDVASVALKWRDRLTETPVGMLARSVAEPRLDELLDALAAKLLGPGAKPPTRDCGALGLKAVLAETDASAAPALTRRLLPKLVAYVASPSGDTDVKAECLDLLTDLAGRCGPALSSGGDADKVLAAIVPQLDAPKAGVRKRAAAALAALAAVGSDAVLASATAALVARLGGGGAKKSPELVRAAVAAAGSLARSTGYRFGRSFPALAPLLLSACPDPGDESRRSAADDELRESVLGALEAAMTRCPREAAGLGEGIESLALRCLSYDPNFAGGDDGGDDDVEAMEDDGGGEGDEGGDAYSDDEDASWKVRRAAAKLLAAAATSATSSLPRLYATTVPKLLARLGDREESVRLDVLAAITELIRQTGAVGRREGGAAAMAGLESVTPALAGRLGSLAGGRSPRGRAAACATIRLLAGVLPHGGLGPHVGPLMARATAGVADAAATTALRLEALELSRALLITQSAESLAPHLASLVPPVVNACAEKYYRVAAEALRAAGDLCRSLRPRSPNGLPAPGAPPGAAAMASSMAGAVSARLGQDDQDQEVKDAAVGAAGAIVAELGDVLAPGQTEGLVATVTDRLKAEQTRIAAARALAAIAASPIRPPLGPSLCPSVAALASFLRQAARPVRVAAIAGLESIVAAGHCASSAAGVAALVAAAPDLAAAVTESDLPLAASALAACVGALAATALHPLPLPAAAPAVTTGGKAARKVSPRGKKGVTVPPAADAETGAGAMTSSRAIAAALTAHVLPAALSLLASPLLTGPPLAAVQHFLVRLASAAADNSAESQRLSGVILAAARAPGTARSTAQAAASCAAALAVGEDSGRVVATVDDLAAAIGKGAAAAAAGPLSPGAESELLLALYTVGEMGRRVDLGGHKSLPGALDAALASAPGADCASAAACALGAVAAGSPGRFLPTLLHSVLDAPPGQQYAMLHALREVLSAGALPPARAPETLALLLRRADGGEEGLRNVVAECLAKLALWQGAAVLPEVIAQLTGGSGASERVRAVAALALKTAVGEAGRAHAAAGDGGVGATGPTAAFAADALVAASLTVLPSVLADPDLGVRKAGVQLLGAVGHSRTAATASGLLPLLPALYAQTVARPELVHTVDLGPFKHVVDDGLPLRLAAYECADVILESLGEDLDPAGLIARLADGLGDAGEIKAACHGLLAKLCRGPAVAAVLAALPSLLPPLEATLFSRPKDDAVQTEVDRAEELTRSALKALAAVRRAREAEASPRLAECMQRLAAAGGLAAKMAAITAEADAA